MSTKDATASATVEVAKAAVRAVDARPDAKKARLSKLEVKRLEQFKALMKEYGGKLKFEGFDE